MGHINNIEWNNGNVFREKGNFLWSVKNNVRQYTHITILQ